MAAPSSGPRGCGGVGCGGFFGQEAQPDRSNWSYVGEGRGGYEKVETLVWVGEGNGTYDREQEQRPQQRGGGYRRLYMSIMVMLVLAGAVCLLASIATGPKKPSRKDDKDRGRESSQVSGELNCSLSEDAVSEPHKQWCCANEGKMCPKLDCEAGYSDWSRGWSPGKKIYCCKHYHRGCEGGSTTPRKVKAVGQDTFNCEMSEALLEVKPEEHRTWCCWHYGRGCPGTTMALN
mmetsp:Transcript_110593/g.308062  ORF Transcript_110593/g.308062 Transcript_110593/m.308062 type:complete len:233 (-) Transcript_110593:168-866(-)